MKKSRAGHCSSHLAIMLDIFRMYNLMGIPDASQYFQDQGVAVVSCMFRPTALQMGMLMVAPAPALQSGQHMARRAHPHGGLLRQVAVAGEVSGVKVIFAHVRNAGTNASIFEEGKDHWFFPRGGAPRMFMQKMAPLSELQPIQCNNEPQMNPSFLKMLFPSLG